MYSVNRICMQLAYTFLLPLLPLSLPPFLPSSLPPFFPPSLPSPLFLPCFQDFQQELYQLKDEFERYKMRAQSVLRSKGNNVRQDVMCSPHFHTFTTASFPAFPAPSF